MDNRNPDISVLARALFETAQRAGHAIEQIFAGGPKVCSKDDASPVTDADEAAEKIILSELACLEPDIPVVAEEAVSAGNIPARSNVFFLVDPLDGTKEFIRGTGEFTVNIALVRNGVPCFGIVLAPALAEIYVTLEHGRAIKARVDSGGVVPLGEARHEPIRSRAPVPGQLVALASRSHMNDATRDFISSNGISETRQAGSSLKFCVIAAGEADVYPRFGPTCEWDTAAGDAILRAAGGAVLTEDGTPLCYGKSDESYLNPGFIAWGRPPAEI